MLLLLFLFVISFVFAGREEFVLRKECSRPVHYGIRPCTSKPEIRYHMDPETLTCLAFNFSGCGGNENNYASKSECYRRCLPMDFNRCPANSKPLPRADGSTNCNEMNKCTAQNSYCAMGFVVGICCDQRIRDKVNNNYTPDCGLNKTLVKVNTGSFDEILHGKTCDANFCPTGSTCYQGDYFAYCCRR
ncbi:unnamed protein product [Caenorhabditis auriculariae]|uniref:BPTI/Kunitz inhibitor domain-containing protein n=1 Tax=Caenorhabditis auriculariae TaxID=2777116 RepID=A0A8S1HZV0_9PELO|nr:unnamed protein product [Caenorhabditis auriculariae]